MSRKRANTRMLVNRSGQPPGKAFQIEGISIETVAARSGVTVRRVQYLEREGLVTPIGSGSGTRYFDESAVERIQLVERLMADLGVNLPGAEVILHMRERMLMMLDEIDRLRRH
jgi:MerR family transcriptional regulator, heat shock protein HspR